MPIPIPKSFIATNKLRKGNKNQRIILNNKKLYKKSNNQNH